MGNVGEPRIVNYELPVIGGHRVVCKVDESAEQNSEPGEELCIADIEQSLRARDQLGAAVERIACLISNTCIRIAGRFPWLPDGRGSERNRRTWSILSATTSTWLGARALAFGDSLGLAISFAKGFSLGSNTKRKCRTTSSTENQAVPTKPI